MLTRSNVCEHNSIVHNHSYISLKKQCLSPFAFQWSTLCVRTCVSNSTSELTVCVHVRDRAAASLAAALSRAVGRFLDANKNPSRKAFPCLWSSWLRTVVIADPDKTMLTAMAIGDGVGGAGGCFGGPMLGC